MGWPSSVVSSPGRCWVGREQPGGDHGCKEMGRCWLFTPSAAEAGMSALLAVTLSPTSAGSIQPGTCSASRGGSCSAAPLQRGCLVCMHVCLVQPIWDGWALPALGPPHLPPCQAHMDPGIALPPACHHPHPLLLLTEPTGDPDPGRRALLAVPPAPGVHRSRGQRGDLQEGLVPICQGRYDASMGARDSGIRCLAPETSFPGRQWVQEEVVADFMSLLQHPPEPGAADRRAQPKARADTATSRLARGWEAGDRQPLRICWLCAAGGASFKEMLQGPRDTHHQPFACFWSTAGSRARVCRLGKGGPGIQCPPDPSPVASTDEGIWCKTTQAVREGEPLSAIVMTEPQAIPNHTVKPEPGDVPYPATLHSDIQLLPQQAGMAAILATAVVNSKTGSCLCRGISPGCWLWGGAGPACRPASPCLSFPQGGQGWGCRPQQERSWLHLAPPHAPPVPFSQIGASSAPA